MPKAMQNKGDALVLQVARNEPVSVKIGGTGPFRVALQAEVGAPGSGSWRDIRSWSRRREDKNSDITEFSYSNPNEELQSLRLIVKEADKNASISAVMEVPAEKEVELEPVLREAREAEFIEAPKAAVEEEEERRKAEAARAEAPEKDSIASTTTKKR